MVVSAEQINSLEVTLSMFRSHSEDDHSCGRRVGGFLQVGKLQPSDDAGIERRNLPVTDVSCSSVVFAPEFGLTFCGYRPDMCSFACKWQDFGTSGE